MTRGVKHQNDLLECFLQGQMFHWPRWNLNVCECGQSKDNHKPKATITCKGFESLSSLALNYCKCGQYVVGHQESVDVQCDGFKQRKEITMTQGALREYKFYEYVIPDESVNEVMTALEFHRRNWNTRDKLFAGTMRKLLGAEKIDMNFPKDKSRIIPTLGVAVYPCGIKKDNVAEHQEWGYKQEML